MKIKTISRFSLVFLVGIFLINLISADLGPKPTADISVYYSGNSIEAKTYSKMLECSNGLSWARCNSKEGEICQILNISIFDEEKNCSWKPSPLAWDGECSQGVCHFTYFLPKIFKVAIYYNNRTFISNEVERKSFYADFRLDLDDNGSAKIVETTSFFKRDTFKWIILFVVSLGITIIIELLTALIFLAIARTPIKRILKFVIYANLISLPILWLIVIGFVNLIRFFAGAEIYLIILLEAAVMIFEAIFLKLNNQETLGWIKASSLSIIINLSSIFFGYIALMFISFFIPI